MCCGPTGSALGLPECLKPPGRSPLRPRPAAEATGFVLTHRMAPAGTRPEGPGDRVEGEAGCGSAGWSPTFALAALSRPGFRLCDDKKRLSHSLPLKSSD